MKLVKIEMELVIDDDLENDYDLISQYLNDKLYNDPEFFGEFGPENIENVTDLE